MLLTTNLTYSFFVAIKDIYTTREYIAAHIFYPHKETQNIFS